MPVVELIGGPFCGKRCEVPTPPPPRITVDQKGNQAGPQVYYVRFDWPRGDWPGYAHVGPLIKGEDD